LIWLSRNFHLKLVLGVAIIALLLAMAWQIRTAGDATMSNINIGVAIIILILLIVNRKEL
jgi:hypothetical protein